MENIEIIQKAWELLRLIVNWIEKDIFLNFDHWIEVGGMFLIKIFELAISLIRLALEKI